MLFPIIGAIGAALFVAGCIFGDEDDLDSGSPSNSGQKNKGQRPVSQNNSETSRARERASKVPQSRRYRG